MIGKRFLAAARSMRMVSAIRKRWCGVIWLAHNLLCHRRICRFIDIDMADAFG
jgi:hypothetical protein